MSRSSRSWPLWIPALTAGLVTFAVFLPALQAGFVNWDDDLNLLLNENYRGLSPAHLKWMFTTFHLGPYQPLSWLTLGIDYTLWGMDARGYHLTSLLLHALNAALLVILAAVVFRRAAEAGAGKGDALSVSPKPGLAALGAALLFSVHPLRVESVAWVTERRDVLSGFFFILALLAYMARPRRPRLAFAAWVLSLLSKATGVTAPILFSILDIYPLRRLPADPRRWLDPRYRPVILEKCLYLMVAVVFGIVAIVGQRRAGSLETLGDFTPLDRLGLVAYATAFYLVKMVAPFGLSPLYELKEDFNPLGPVPMLALLLLVGITVLLLAWRRPALLAAWFGYLLLILPVSGVARAGHAVAADRYTYFASIPFSILAGAALVGAGDRTGRRVSVGREERARERAKERAKERAAPARRAATGVEPAAGAADSSGRPALGWRSVAGLVLVAVFGMLTAAQTKVWNNSISLWQQALKVDPKSVNASLSLGYALVEAGRYPEADVLYRDLLKRDPTLADARYNYAMLLYLERRYPDAEAEFTRLTREAPGYAEGHYGLGILYMFQKKNTEARTEFETALRLDPRHRKAREALARLSGAAPAEGAGQRSE